MGLLYAIGRKAHFEVDGVERNVTFAFLTYLVAVPGFFGWIVFVFQGGVGRLLNQTHRLYVLSPCVVKE